MEKIILYYKFTPLADPATVMHWQRLLCQSHDLKGRILLSPHGINGTLGGSIKGLKNYIKAMNLHPAFKGIDYKWSEGGGRHFPKLQVKVRDELVSFGAGDRLQVNEQGVVGGGTHLSPQAVHELVAERGDDVVFFDGRNAYEAAIGRFRGAVVPNTRTAKDFERELDTPAMQTLKDKPVVTYCTGGIRCEVLSSLMVQRGFKEVYQLKGGIVRYGEAYGDGGLWDGKLFVFDDRMSVAFSDAAKDIGQCRHCQSPTSRYVNCANPACNELVLICETCDPEQQAVCGLPCQQAAAVTVAEQK